MDPIHKILRQKIAALHLSLTNVILTMKQLIRTLPKFVLLHLSFENVLFAVKLALFSQRIAQTNKQYKI